MRKRLLFFSLLSTLLFLMLFSVISVEIYYNSSVRRGEDFLRAYLNAFDKNEYSLNDEGATLLSNKLNGVEVVFLSLEGEVLGASFESKTISYMQEKDVADCIKNGEGFFTGISVNSGDTLLYYTKKIDNVLVRISTPILSLGAIVSDYLPTLIIFLVIDIVGCLVFAYFATSYILKPVETIAKECALNKKVETEYAELQSIADIMNSMNGKIKEKIDEINLEKEIVLKATQSKNDFIANITHEMNTPLTAIKGFAEILQNPDLTEEQRGKAIKTILSQSERLTNLISCVINYNEIDNDELPSYEVDVSKIAKEVLDTLKPELEKKMITLTTDIDDKVIVLSRHERIAEIIGNLVRNGIKYNRQNGFLEITLKNDGEKYLKVKDGGIGISKENQEKIFDRFFTVDKSHGGKHGGFGLGLAIVKKLCQKSGWKLSVESQLDLGTEFLIKFD